MRKFVLCVAGAAALALSQASNAAIVIGTNVAGTNPYSGPAPTFECTR